jgi:HD-like signal output (HDOD) protein
VGKVSIQDVTPGMVVERDVNGQNGALLAPRGLTLAEGHIRTLRAFGVHAVDIVSDGPEPDAAIEAFQEAETACLIALRPRFAALDLLAPFGETLWRLAATRLARHMVAAALPLEGLLETQPLLCLPPEQHLFTRQQFDPAWLVSGEVELATLPEVHARLIQALSAPTSSPASIAAVIKHDPSLTAKLLKLVNSPLYGMASPIDTISRAVSVVGQKELSTLVLGLAACQAFTDIDPELCDMRAFWRHAAACGVYASGLAEACPGTAPDRVFVGGLLHDIGQLVILRKIPAAAGRALLLSRIEGLPLCEAETAVLGFDHAQVGRALLTNWNFPASLRDMVADHHQPSGRSEARETAIIHVADILATALDASAKGGPLVPPLAEAAWHCLGLPESTLMTVAEAGDERIRDIEDVFFTDNRHHTQ